jgi:hypothetical protein
VKLDGVTRVTVTWYNLNSASRELVTAYSSSWHQPCERIVSPVFADYDSFFKALHS